MGEGWYYDFKHTHFDAYSPPDFYARVRLYKGSFAFNCLKNMGIMECISSIILYIPILPKYLLYEVGHCRVLRTINLSKIGSMCTCCLCCFGLMQVNMQIGIAGVRADTVMKKTKTLEDNWIPNWNEEFTFPLTVPELALLRIEVHEYDMSEKDDFGGQSCLPVSELRSGIRAVPLYSRKGEKYNSVKVLVRFEFI